MRIMEILMYHRDATELENSADAALMQHLANLFTRRRGLVKALTGFGPTERRHDAGTGSVPSQTEIDAEMGRVPRRVTEQSPLRSAGWGRPCVRGNPGLRRSARCLPVYRPY